MGIIWRIIGTSQFQASDNDVTTFYVRSGHLSNGKVFLQRLFHTNQIIPYSMRNFDTLLRVPVDSKAVKGDFVQLHVLLMIFSSLIFKK